MDPLMVVPTDAVELEDEPLLSEIIEFVGTELEDKDVVLSIEELPLRDPLREAIVVVVGIIEVELPTPTLTPTDRSVPEAEKEEIVLLTEELPLGDPVAEVIVVVPRMIIVELPIPALTSTERSVPDVEDKEIVVELPTPALTPTVRSVPDGRILFSAG
ncbi:hypothetical protein MMC17_009124 [Xylographa soralifera]|nr:hypothetical protein [Xylographa soralifera]